MEREDAGVLAGRAVRAPPSGPANKRAARGAGGLAGGWRREPRCRPAPPPARGPGL